MAKFKEKMLNESEYEKRIDEIVEE